MVNAKRVCWLLLILAPVIAASGCPGTDILRTGNGTYVIEVVVTNNDPVVDGFRYDFADLFIGQVNIRPVDSVADAALGPRDIGAVSGAIDINLTMGTAEPTTLLLSSGAYRLTLVQVAGIDLFDFDATFTACDDFDEYPAQFTQNLYDLEDFGQTVILNVDADTEGTLTITIDAQAFVDAFEAGFTCNLTQQCGFGFNAVPPPCILNFSESTFVNGMGAAFSFN